MGSSGLRREPIDRGGSASDRIARVCEVLDAGTDTSGEGHRYRKGKDGSSEGCHTGLLPHFLKLILLRGRLNLYSPFEGEIRSVMGRLSLLMVQRACSLFP